MKKYKYCVDHKDFVTPNSLQKKSWCPSHDVHMSDKHPFNNQSQTIKKKRQRKKSDIVYVCKEKDALCRKASCVESYLKHATFDLKEEQVENKILKEKIKLMNQKIPDFNHN